MYGEERARFTDAELHAFFDRLFPHGFGAADVLAEIAPKGWEQSPLLACFHPSVEQRYHEAVQLHRNIEELSRAIRRKDVPEREPVFNTLWTPQVGIEAMDKAGVDIAYQSHATYYTKQGLMQIAGKNPRKSETVIKYARESNEYGARITADSKGRFRFLPVIPLPDIDGCLKEIEYAYSSLKPVGVCLPGSVGGRDYIGNVKWFPILEELNRRKSIVHVHPAEPDWSLDLEPGIDAPNVWYGVDTAVAIATLLTNNVATKYPNIKWVFSHGGGGFPALAGRIINLRPEAEGRGAAPAAGGRGNRASANPTQGLHDIRTFYYDCAASTNRFTMQALQTLVKNSQLVFGSDYPWSNITSLTTALPDCGFTPTELNALSYGNGERMAATT